MSNAIITIAEPNSAVNFAIDATRKGAIAQRIDGMARSNTVVAASFVAHKGKVGKAARELTAGAALIDIARQVRFGGYHAAVQKICIEGTISLTVRSRKEWEALEYYFELQLSNVKHTYSKAGNPSGKYANLLKAQSTYKAICDTIAAMVEREQATVAQ